MKMKILSLMLVCLAFPASSQAQTPTPFDYTGVNASNYGSVSNPDYQLTPNPIPVGGPSDDGGGAEQFTISSLTNISAIDVNAVVFASGNPMSYNTAPTTFNYEIMSSLNSNSILATSNLVSFPDPSMSSATATSSSYTDINVSINAQLQPGTYWLAELGNGSAVVDTTQEYVDPPSGDSFPTAAAPEPTTWVLLGMGILGLFFSRKWRVV